MKVISWNVNQWMSHERAEAVAGWLKDQKPDVLLLQELVCGRDEIFEAAFSAEHHWHYGRVRGRGDVGLHGAAVAVSRRFEAMRVEPIDGACRELVVGVRSPELGLVVSAHIPNGTGWGWEKMRVWQKLQGALREHSGPVILGGDFNAPALEGGKKTYCFGYTHRTESGVRTMSPKIAAGLRDRGIVDVEAVYWGPWEVGNRPEGTEGTGEDWERIESWIYNATAEHRLVDAYRAAPTKLEDDLGHSHYAAGRFPMRYDHVFVRGYEPHSAGYPRMRIKKHAIAPAGEPGSSAAADAAEGFATAASYAGATSDHAPLVVCIAPA